jgi:hypothetical protein
LPRAVSLYGPLPQQLKRPDSFASQLARLLKVRSGLRLYAGELVDVPKVQAKGLIVLVHRLPGPGDLEVTAINFGASPVDETVKVAGTVDGQVAADVLDSGAPPIRIGPGGGLHLRIAGLAGTALRIGR